MKTKSIRAPLLCAVAAWVLAGAGIALAEDLVLFKASSAGPDAWGWGEAKLKKDKDGFAIQENGKQNSVGDVYVLERFAYLPEGVVELDINRVSAGSATLQLLAFKGDAHIGTADLAKEIKVGGKQQFPLKGVQLPPETEMITFKIWIGGARGAAMVLNDLTYSASIPADKIAADKKITSDTTGIVTDKTSWMPSDKGGTIALLTTDASGLIGSAVLPDVFKNPKEGMLLLDVPSVRNGNISVQLVAFDEKSAYLNSVEVINKVGAGWYAVPLWKVQWPEGTDSFKVKIWLGGTSESIGTATVRRVMVIK